MMDHNFSPKSERRDLFLTHSVELGKAVARQMNRYPLFILLGFEVDIGYHVLCFFRADKESEPYVCFA